MSVWRFAEKCELERDNWLTATPAWEYKYHYCVRFSISCNFPPFNSFASSSSQSWIVLPFKSSHQFWKLPTIVTPNPGSHPHVYSVRHTTKMMYFTPILNHKVLRRHQLLNQCRKHNQSLCLLYSSKESGLIPIHIEVKIYSLITKPALAISPYQVWMIDLANIDRGR